MLRVKSIADLTDFLLDLYIYSGLSLVDYC